MANIKNKGFELLNQRYKFDYEFNNLNIGCPIIELFFRYYLAGNIEPLEYNLLKDDTIMNFDRRTIYVTRKIWFENILFYGYKYENSLYEIFPSKTIERNLERYKNGDRDVDDKGYILIGYMDAYGDWLLLGVEDYNRDQIFADGVSDVIEKVADNIFELFTMVSSYWDDYLVTANLKEYSGNDLYKKWGEIEWMVRGHEPEKEDWEKNETLFLKAGLGLLKQRNDNPKILEMLLKKLPFRASIFFKYYNTGNYEDMINFVPYRLDLPDGTQGLVVEDRWFEQMPDINYRFGRLLSLEELAEEFDKYAGQKEEYHKTGFVQIGEMQNNAIKILLGIAEDVIEQITICDESGHHKKIANDIFHFFTFVNRYWSDKDIVKATNGAKTGEDLYQNWGENFWRVI